MKLPKYYLISYYARLPKGGFGFSRTYYFVAAAEEFSLLDFEKQMATESQLEPNDISLISRIEVKVEEFNENVGI